MTNLNSLNRSSLRLTGLNSGFDTESIVTSLLKIDQLKYDKQWKIKEKLTWKADAYRDINLKLRNFREKFMSVLAPETNIFSSSAYKSFQTNMITETSAAKVTAGSNAAAGVYSINEITQLAEAASVRGQSMFSGTVSLDTKLGEANFNNALEFGENGTIEFEINGKSFSFNEKNTLNDVVVAVNNANVGVTMGYSALSKGFTLVSRNTGSDQEISIVNKSGNAFAADAAEAAFGIRADDESPVAVGKDAILKIEGHEVVQSSNSFAIDGIQYELKSVFNSSLDPATHDPEKSIRFGVERDIEPVFQKIKGFIDGYNELISQLQSMYDERPERGYDPLTEEERGNLTEKQAEKWDASAKKGMLYRDANISSILSTMRDAFYTKVDGVGRSGADVGLRTSKNYYDNGKIVIDEEALRSALSNNPDQVREIFTKASAATDGKQKYLESGLVTRISDAMNNTATNITNNTLVANAREVKSAESMLEKLENWLAANEKKYWARFTAMETALSEMQSQTNWISSMLGSNS